MVSKKRPKAPKSKPSKGKKEIFCRYIKKNGKIIYPKKSKVFHFFI